MASFQVLSYHRAYDHSLATVKPLADEEAKAILLPEPIEGQTGWIINGAFFATVEQAAEARQQYRLLQLQELAARRKALDEEIAKLTLEIQKHRLANSPLTPA
jgi:hypothetical protein